MGRPPGLTLHRLLGWRFDNSTRFRHDRGNRLKHDVVVVDESSMVELTMMARLLEALRPDSRLIVFRGKRNEKAVPRPGSDSMLTRPAIRVASRATIDSPSPRPLRWSRSELPI